MKQLKIFFILVLVIAPNVCTAQTVYVTRTGKKYHRETCQYLRLSKIKTTVAEASKFYDPCSVCKPPRASSVEEDTGSPATSSEEATPVSSTPTVSKQCTASTKAGTRCKRMTTSASGRCYQHQ